jgi:phage minor structural protein
LNTFGVIDETLKPKEPQIYLALPNRKIIGKLNHFIYKPHNHSINLGTLNEIEFRVPYDIEDSTTHLPIKNPFADRILERYLLKIKLDDFEEWYIINSINDDMDENSDTMTVHAFSLGYELANKLIREYKKVKSLWEVAHYTLADTLWTVGEIDDKFTLKFRSFDVSETTALDFIDTIAQTFGALVEYDTVNRVIHFRDPEKLSKYDGLTIGYGKYLKTLGKTSTADEMVTRLYIYGHDGLSIQRVNPAGTSYLEDFSYFMYPFERDENRNVIKSSRYGMSDELCHAILDYNELLKENEGVFATLLEEEEELQTELFTKNSELFDLQTNYEIVQQRLDVQRKHGTFLYREYKLNNSTEKVGFDLTKTSYHALMMKSSNKNISVKIQFSNDQTVYTRTIPSANKWHVIDKFYNKEIAYVYLQGTGNVELYFVEIFEDEYRSTNENVILEKYNEHIAKEKVDNKQKEIDELEADLAIVENEIQDFQEMISVENNFTEEQLKERKKYIIERTWTDENYDDDEELLEVAKEKFLEFKLPKTTIDLNIINFLSVLSESYNWDRLKIGHEIRIRYEKIGVDIRAKVIQIQFDYENETINLKIANVKDLFGDAARLLEMLKSSYSTSTSVGMNKGNWNEAVEGAKSANEILNQTWEAAKRRILAGTNESVDIGNRGVVVRSPDNPNHILIIQSGIIGLSMDGGMNWQTAIMPEGIIAERLMGKVILGERVEIGDNEGTFTIVGNLLTIKDRNDIVRLLLGEYEDNKFGLKLFNKSGRNVILDENGMLQTWQEGRADNVDETHGLSLWVYVPEETLEIRKALLRFKLLPFRSYSGTTESAPAQTRTSSSGGGTSTTTAAGGGVSTTTASGGGTSRSTESGGASTRTSTSAGRHRHTMATITGGDTAPPPTNWRFFDIYMGPQNTFGVMKLPSDTPASISTYEASGEHSHTVSIPAHSHSFSVPNHTHSISLNPHTHNITIPNHTHTVEIPAHKHAIVHDIFEASGKANGIGIIINGIERTNALGGKFYTDEKGVDISRYLAVGAWNEVVLTSQTLGRIDASIFVQAFLSTEI